MAVKEKAFVPAPTKYKVEGNLADTKHNPCHQKSPRLTEAAEIQIKEKRRKMPAVGAYKPNFKRVEPSTLGCFKWKSDRAGYLEEAMWRGSKQPAFGLPKVELTKPTTRVPRIWKMVPEKKKEKQSLSPTSYQPMDSYKKTQLNGSGVFMSKSPRLSMLKNFQRRTSYL